MDDERMVLTSDNGTGELERRPYNGSSYDGGRGSGEGPNPVTVTIIKVALALVIGLVSAFPLANLFSSTEFHAASISSLDSKRDTVMTLVASSTATSAAISFLPGDAGTPIAEKMADLSGYFLIVLATIFLEKYLLTILGLATFRLLIPLGMAALIVAALLELRDNDSAAPGQLTWMAVRLIAFGIVIFAVVPASIYLANMIESTYETSIDETLAEAEAATETVEQTENTGEESDTDLLGEIVSGLTDTVSGATSATSSALDAARTALNGFIESLAVMIVTSCVIPILVLVFFVWVVKLTFGVTIDLRAPMHMAGMGRHRH